MDFGFDRVCEQSWAEFVCDPVMVVPLDVRSWSRSREEHWTLKLLSESDSDSGSDWENQYGGWDEWERSA